MTLFRWMFKRQLAAEYNEGYRAAVDAILLLPEKVRLGNTLEVGPGSRVDNCSFVVGAGGGPAIRIDGAFDSSAREVNLTAPPSGRPQ